MLAVGFDHQINRHQASETVALRTTPGKYIQIPPGSSFKIALFADLHFGENAWTVWGPRQDANSIKVMNTILDEETPGDFIT